MKVAVVAILALAAAALLWMLWRPDSIEYHKHVYFKAVERLQGGRKGGSLVAQLRYRISQWLGGNVDDNQVMRRHEDALIRLGYLTKQDFHLTNQVLTHEFRSNFYLRIQQTFGTNRETVWAYRSFSNGAGLHVTLPTRDVSRWDHIFRECADRYASNAPAPGP